MHSAEAAALLRGDNYEAVTWLSEREVVRPPRPGWSARQFRVPPVRPSRLLQDGKGAPPAGERLLCRPAPLALLTSPCEMIKAVDLGVPVNLRTARSQHGTGKSRGGLKCFFQL